MTRKSVILMSIHPDIQTARYQSNFLSGVAPVLAHATFATTPTLVDQNINPHQCRINPDHGWNSSSPVLIDQSYVQVINIENEPKQSYSNALVTND